jgi:hypothetical protein
MPRISVKIAKFWPSPFHQPMATPATGDLIGTPVSIGSVEAHTEAIEVEPFEDKTSETRRKV